MIYVSSQAVKGAQRTDGFSRFRALAREEIIREVEHAFKVGLVSSTSTFLPPGFVLGRALRHDEVLATNGDRSRVWVVACTEGTCLVRKLLTRREARAA